MRKNMKHSDKILEVQRWFARSVTYEGEPYVMDVEQTAAVIDDSRNTIIVARAGSGKTRTIVAKIVYLIAKLGLKPDEIIAFVFNANAAKEINERLSKMRVDGKPIMDDGAERAKVDLDGVRRDVSEGKNRDLKAVRMGVATTFHAFARRIVYDFCGGRDKCGKILAGEKESYILEIVRRMMREGEWLARIVWFVKGGGVDDAWGEIVDKYGRVAETVGLSNEEVLRFAKMMTQFVNRAQQKYLNGEKSLREVADEYLNSNKVDERERVFVGLGVECFKRYHWYLLDAKRKIWGFEEYGTDFNLIVSWASKLIALQRDGVKEWLTKKKYILIDEYQDFSQLFLAAVRAVRIVAKDAKLFVVGDDLQAINRFAGSEVEYFKEFEKYFTDEAKRLEITTNYRCDKEVVRVARKFMMKAMNERGEFRAKARRSGKVVLVNPRMMECEYAVMNYDKRVSGRDDVYRQAARRIIGRVPKMTTVKYIKILVEIIKKNCRLGDILLLHRNNETNIEGVSLVKLSNGLKWALAQLEVMSEKEYDMQVRLMTMHKSKGLEANVVIILEADEGVIPKTHPDTQLYGMFGETEEVALDDQKRLFYVAMTRAKRRLYIIHDDVDGVGFIKYLGRVEKWEA